MKQFLAFLLLPISLLAQPRTYERPLVALQFQTKPIPADIGAYSVAVTKPTCLQLTANQTFVVQAKWQQPNDTLQQIGLGTITSLSAQKVVLNLVPDKGFSIKTGDMAMFLVPLPPAGNDSLFFKFARLAIGFTTVEDSAFYQRDSLLCAPAAYPATKLANAMAADIRYTGTEMASQNNGQDQPVTKGHYAGQHIFSLMQKTTSSDVFSFLQYVYINPLRYMGGDWKISETFATWVVSGAPGK